MKKQTKTRVIIGVVVIVLVIVIVILVAVRKGSNTEGDDTEGEAVGSGMMLKSSPKLSYSISKFNGLAEAIYDATWNQGLGTNEEKIKRVFRLMKTDADVAQLEKSFGKRHYIGALYELSGWFNREEDLPLKTHLKYEGMVSSVNAILKKKGLKRRY